MPAGHFRAFLRVPLIAAGTWYVATLGQLAVGNGRLRLGPDLLALGFGAMTIGLLTAALATVVLALPAYFLVHRAIGDSPAGTLIAGAAIGLIVGVLIQHFTGNEPLLLPPLKAIAIGLASAAWWLKVARGTCYS